MSKTNSEYQKEWYYRQKNNGIVYLLTIDDKKYVGSTTNSLEKRLYQHRSSAYIGELLLNAKKVSMEILERASKPSELRSLEQKWLDMIKPDINQNAAMYRKQLKRCYKGGVTFNGEWFPTKLEAWKKYGTTPLGTFKSRWYRTRKLEYCLGTIEQKKEGSI